jgi:CDP-diglyceride synthetase
MIQRIQSVYLLIAVIVTLVAVILCVEREKFSDFCGYVVLSSLSVILSVVALFRYAHRKSQMKLISVSIFNLCIAIVMAAVMSCVMSKQATLFNYVYIILLSLAVLFNYMARRSVVRDEMKVRSADRIR